MKWNEEKELTAEANEDLKAMTRGTNLDSPFGFVHLVIEDKGCKINWACNGATSIEDTQLMMKLLDTATQYAEEINEKLGGAE